MPPRPTDNIAPQTYLDLFEGFVEPESASTGCEPVEPQAIPQPARNLLVHTELMTTRLRTFFGQPVNLRVLKHRRSNEHYSRMILLTLSGSQRVVEFAIARLNLNDVLPDVRAEILARRLPLGEVLIRHNVLRRIEPRCYLRFGPQSPLLTYFQSGFLSEPRPALSEPRPSGSGFASEPRPSGSGFAFGRVGSILVDNRPAIELLEVVTGE